MVQHCEALGRAVQVVNLDPAAELFSYPVMAGEAPGSPRARLGTAGLPPPLGALQDEFCCSKTPLMQQRGEMLENRSDKIVIFMSVNNSRLVANSACDRG